MEFTKIFTAIYAKTAFSAFIGYIQEMPEKDTVDYSLGKVKTDLKSELDKWKEETGNDYILKEIYK